MDETRYCAKNQPPNRVPDRLRGKLPSSKVKPGSKEGQDYCGPSEGTRTSFGAQRALLPFPSLSTCAGKLTEVPTTICCLRTKGEERGLVQA